MVHLITGYAGYEHIQSEDDGAFNAAFFGNGQYVMETGNQFEGSIINNNTVRILDGDGLMYGRHFRIKPNTYEDLNITTGTAGTRRVDMICMTYEKNAGDGTEQAYLQVVKGAETSGTPAAPSYTDGNILDGATFNQMPLYKVEIEGVVLSSITALFDTIPTYKALAETYEAKFKAACQSHLDSLGVLDTMEEITANTQSNQLAGALGVKQIYNQLNTDSQWKKITVPEPSVSDGSRIYTIDLSTYKEICIRIWIIAWLGSVDIKIIPLNMSTKKYIHCYYDGTYYANAEVTVTKNDITIKTVASNMTSGNYYLIGELCAR